MIRINLLPHKKKRSTSIEGEQTVAVGFGILMACAALVYFLVHQPAQTDVDDQKKVNSRINRDNTAIEKQTKEFDNLKAAFKAAQEQADAISALNNSRSSPANFLYELATILTPDGEPKMTPAMARQLEENENLRWQEGWDPKHVWIDQISEEEGAFTLLGSAQSDGDVTQLAHRLAASMYFENVQPEGSVKKSGKESGLTIYSFKITGTVRY